MNWRDYDAWGPVMLPLARNEVERSLLRPPFVGQYDDNEVVMNGANRWRAATKVDL
jgi:hypothetical protein